ncbi:MAG: serine/threonine protein kinase [Planctomycetes bacterium]|nr:serine/threonine protein kinase [Planctomycetota bacterium]
MGVVYKALQPNLERHVALKVLPKALSENEEFTRRFMREARALAALNHPHIVAVYEFGSEEGRYFIVMEYVDGTSLRPILEKKTLAPADALKIIPALCDALEYAHSEHVVHRDIKPENVLLDRRGRVKIADFGLAKLMDAAAPAFSQATRTSVVIGTPHYMAPEQYGGSKAVDHRADIYSMGVLFYEMLTGELPIGRFPPPSQRAPVDARLDEIVLRTLEREPAQRYQSMGDVKRDVTRITQTPPRPEPPPRPGKRAAAAAVFVLGLLALPVLWHFWAPRPSQPPSLDTLSAADLAKAENLLAQNQPSLALEVLERRIAEDPENAELRACAVTAARKHLDAIEAQQGKSEALNWLGGQLREKSYLNPLAARFAVLDTEIALETMLASSDRSSTSLRDRAGELLRRYPKPYEVPCAAARILERLHVPESVLWLYREAFKRGLPAGDAHAFEIAAKALANNRPESDDGKYVQEFVKEFYPRKRVEWAALEVESAHGLLFLNACAVLKDAVHPKRNDAVLQALETLLTPPPAAATPAALEPALAALRAAPETRRAFAAGVLKRSLEANEVPSANEPAIQALLPKLTAPPNKP